MAIVDVEMPGLDGLAATAALRAAVPDVRVLIVTTFGRPGYLQRAMEAGALGFMVKERAAGRAGGGRPTGGRRGAGRRPGTGGGDAGRWDEPADRPRAGRPRRVRDGSTVSDVAARLFLSEGTVRNYLSSAIAKTGSRNRVEAVQLATERGWL